MARVTPSGAAAFGPGSRQRKLVLRGKAGLSEGRLIDALNQELVQAMSAHQLPKVGLHLLGSGTLSWGYGKDHGVHILPGVIMVVNLPLAPSQSNGLCFLFQALGWALIITFSPDTTSGV